MVTLWITGHHSVSSLQVYDSQLANIGTCVIISCRSKDFFLLVTESWEENYSPDFKNLTIIYTWEQMIVGALVFVYLC